MQTESADFCIVGAGVAGSILAFRLAQSGARVIVVDAGPWHDVGRRFEYMELLRHGIRPWESNNPERDAFTSDGPYNYLLDEKRVKAVGGSGLHWGGMASRLHESDFELESRYGLGFDWPIGYADLEPYYTAAEKLIGVAGEDAYPVTPPRGEPYPMPPFPFSHSDTIWQAAFDRLEIPLHHTSVARTSVPYDGRQACQSFDMCHTCPVLAKWTPDLLMARAEGTGRVTVRPDTRAIEIRSNPAGTRVEGVVCVSGTGAGLSETTYVADTFVLAAHAVETVRLMLLSPSAAHPQGLGNERDLVGRYFMDHPDVYMAGEFAGKAYPGRIGFETSASHFFYDRNRDSGGNAFIVLPANADIRTPLDAANEALQAGPIWGEALKARVQERFGYTIRLACMTEHLPYWENRIGLDDRVMDDLGMAAPKITYSFEQEREVRTMEAATETMRRLFEALDAREVQFQGAGVSGHHMGGCIMGRDAESSVVDRNLKVHALDNLYVGGSSVFPTTGAVPPTLTIAALALRLGDHLTAVGRQDVRAGNFRDA